VKSICQWNPVSNLRNWFRNNSNP